MKMDALLKEITSILTKLIQLNEKKEKVYFLLVPKEMTICQTN